MKRFLNLINKKQVSMTLYGVVALTLGTTASFAAATPKSGTEMTAQVKIENGVQLYSTDNGKTWSKFSPISTEEAFKFSMGKDGRGTIESTDSLGDTDSSVDFKVKSGATPKSGTEMTAQVKTENGVPFYSTDNGKTWSKTAPKLKTK
nr:hypothetical protein [Brevibacillus laterosporus]